MTTSNYCSLSATTCSVNSSMYITCSHSTCCFEWSGFVVNRLVSSCPHTYVNIEKVDVATGKSV